MGSYTNPYILKLINMESSNCLALFALYSEENNEEAATACLKHSKMLRELYTDLGESEPMPPVDFVPDIRDIAPLRTIYFTLRDIGHKNILFEIITDRLLLIK